MTQARACTGARREGAALILGAVLACLAALPAFANPGMGGGEDHHHTNSGGGGCGSCGGGSGSDEASRRDARERAGNAATAGDNGGTNVTAGSRGRSSEDLTGSIADLGTATDQSAAICDDLRREIDGWLQAIDTHKRAVLGQQHLDSYTQMGSFEIDVTIRNLEVERLGAAGSAAEADLDARISFLRQIKALRAQHGGGRGFRDALARTQYYQQVQGLNRADGTATSGDVGASIRDLQARYRAAGC